MSVDIAFYLSHLLYQNNVAILPGFGAFVTTPTPSVIDHARGTFSPPSKIVTFNENLKINDGFLINLIRNKHGYSAHEARAIVENFVSSINDILKNRDTVRLDKIGKLYLNLNNQVIFEPEQKSNFNLASFGLPDVKHYPLPKQRLEPTTPQPKIEPAAIPTEPPPIKVAEPIEMPQPQAIVKEIKPSWFEHNKFAAAALAFGLIATTAIWYFNKKRTAAEGGEPLSVPVSEIRINVKPGMEKDTENETIVQQNADSQASITTDDKSIVDAPSQPTLQDNETNTKSKPKSKYKDELNAAPIMPESVTTATQTIYIIGTYSKPANIRRTSRLIKQKGFELYNVPFNGMRRVGAVLRFNSEIEKMTQIERLKAVFGEGIWELEN
jgi:hypothetical protein